MRHDGRTQNAKQTVFVESFDNDGFMNTHYTKASRFHYGPLPLPAVATCLVTDSHGLVLGRVLSKDLGIRPRAVRAVIDARGAVLGHTSPRRGRHLVVPLVDLKIQIFMVG